MKIKALEKSIEDVAADLKLEALMSQKLRESLIKKGIID